MRYRLVPRLGSPAAFAVNRIGAIHCEYLFFRCIRIAFRQAFLQKQGPSPRPSGGSRDERDRHLWSSIRIKQSVGLLVSVCKLRVAKAAEEPKRPHYLE